MAGFNRVIDAEFSHRDIGVFAIDHQCLDKTTGNMFPSDDHRRAGKTTARKHRRGASAHGGINDSQIEGGILYADVFCQRQKSLGMVKLSGLPARGR
jgi:hypothetical protein